MEAFKIQYKKPTKTFCVDTALTSTTVSLATLQTYDGLRLLALALALVPVLVLVLVVAVSLSLCARFSSSLVLSVC
jgi:hypothetical protein